MHYMISRTAGMRHNVIDAVTRLRNFNDALVGPQPQDPRPTDGGSSKQPLMAQLEGEISGIAMVIDDLHREISRLEGIFDMGNGSKDVASASMPSGLGRYA